MRHRARDEALGLRREAEAMTTSALTVGSTHQRARSTAAAPTDAEALGWLREFDEGIALLAEP